MEINNDLPEEEDYTNPVDSSHLSYAGTAKVGNSVSMATDKEAAVTTLDWAQVAA